MEVLDSDTCTDCCNTNNIMTMALFRRSTDVDIAYWGFERSRKTKALDCILAEQLMCSIVWANQNIDDSVRAVLLREVGWNRAFWLATSRKTEAKRILVGTYNIPHKKLPVTPWWFENPETRKQVDHLLPRDYEGEPCWMKIFAHIPCGLSEFAGPDILPI